ncbi:MAG: glycerate kinase, partial [Akkermansia sp.]|nr:glycerate kinase [Akkermansia sp.]
EHTLREPQVQTHLLPGAGAAGGVGYAVNHFLGGKIISGWRFFANLTNLQQKIAQADLVISGEGRIDSQSLNGKVVDGVITLAKEAGKPVWLFCGLNSLGADSLSTASLGANLPGIGQPVPIFQLASLEPDRDKSMQNAAPLLERLARQAATSHLNSDGVGNMP